MPLGLLPYSITAGAQGSDSAPERGFLLPTSQNGNLIKIDVSSRDPSVMPFKMRNKRNQSSPSPEGLP